MSEILQIPIELDTEITKLGVKLTKTLSGFEFLECSLSGEKYPIDKPMRLSPSSETTSCKI